MPKLLKVLGVAFGLAIIVGNTIGAGILRTPGEVAAALPNAPLVFLVWMVGGVYALLGAASLCELTVALPKSGGQYVYARYAFGEFVGFAVGCSDWVSSAASMSLMAIAAAEIATPMLGLRPREPWRSRAYSLCSSRASMRSVRERATSRSSC
jgi:APA family basic amino acid/polyamine antiporter